MPPDSSGPKLPTRIGRYALYGEIATGGMATVHLGRLLGPVGFSRTVAIKRLHPQLARDPEFAAMFLDEALLAARVRHPNVVATLDVLAEGGELFLVMEYVHGESLARVLRLCRTAGEPMPVSIASNIVSGALQGLHAAHTARNERGEPLGLVHRDVSPENVLVGLDGGTSVVDFGVAKAAGQYHSTRSGQLKGKLAYMSPEQVTGKEVTPSTDIFAASVVLWEVLTGRRLFRGASEGEVVYQVVSSTIPLPSTVAPWLPRELDAVVMKGLDRDPATRFASAREMSAALERACPPASQREVGEWVERVAGEHLARRGQHVSEIESASPAPEDATRQYTPATIGTPPGLDPPASSQVSSVAVWKGLPQGPGASRRALTIAAACSVAGVFAIAGVARFLLARPAPQEPEPRAAASAVAPVAETARPEPEPTAAAPTATATASASAAAAPAASSAAPVAVRRPPKPAVTSRPNDSIFTRK